eukprot:655836-Amphidinium_carterae.2
MTVLFGLKGPVPKWQCDAYVSRRDSVDVNRREASTSKRVSEESKALASKSRKLWKNLSGPEKVAFFTQWQQHREDAEPLAWTSTFNESLTSTTETATKYKRVWRNQQQLLKEFGQDHLRGEEASKMLSDILLQQAAKHRYPQQTQIFEECERKPCARPLTSSTSSST